MIDSDNIFFAFNSPQSIPKLIFYIFDNYEAFHSFNLKLVQLSCEIVRNFVLLDNYFTDLLTEVQIGHRKTSKFGPGRSLER